MTTPQLQSEYQWINHSDIRVMKQTEIRVPFKIKSFPNNSLKDAINLMYYGVICKGYNQQKNSWKLHSTCTIYIDPENIRQLNVLSQKLKGSKVLSRELLQFPIIKIHSLSNQYSHEVPDVLNNNKSLFIIYKTTQNEKYCLLFSDPETKDLFYQGLQQLVLQEFYNLQFIDYIQFLEHQISFLIDTSTEIALSPQNVKEIMKGIGFHISLKKIKVYFFERDEITYKQFKQQLPKIFYVQETKSIFNQYSEFSNIINDPQVGCMKLSEFKTFLLEVQKETDDLVYKETISLIYPESSKIPYQLISQDQFSSFLLNRENLIIDQKRTEIYQDMSQPLGNYFINCSRQTMQLDINVSLIEKMKKYSDLEKGAHPILFAIESGCRYIEINIWDGPNEKPICYYGPMMNYCVSLVFLFEIIKKYAFQYSQFPFIVYLNDHCTRKQKLKMTELIKQVLGTMLETKNKEQLYLGSPESLKLKVLLCNKIMMKSNQQYGSSYEPNYDYEAEEIYYSSKDSNMKQFQAISNQFSQSKPSLQVEGVLTTKRDSVQESVQPSFLQSSMPQNLETHKICDQLDGPLDNSFYLHEIIQEGFIILDHPEFVYSVTDWIRLKGIRSSKRKSSRIGSNLQRKSDQSDKISTDIDRMQQEKNHEDILQKFIKNPIMQVQKYSKIGKIFKYQPSCKQIDTQNPYTSQAFLSGSSLIMMHSHLIDYNFMYHQAKFMENGGKNSGYLLKPQFKNQNDFNHIVYQNSNHMMKIKVISGYHIQTQKYPNGCQPILQIIIRYPRNTEEDYIDQSTSQLQEDSFNPSFNLTCEVNIKSLELSVLMLVIYHENGENLVCWNSFPLSIIKQGYRIIPLKDDLNNELENSYLLADIMIS